MFVHALILNVKNVHARKVVNVNVVLRDGKEINKKHASKWNQGRIQETGRRAGRGWGDIVETKNDAGTGGGRGQE